MAGKQKSSEGRARTRRKPAPSDDWLEQFAPAAPGVSPDAPPPAPTLNLPPTAAPPDPRSRVDAPRPSKSSGGSVPGSRGLDADLHSAALRELGLDVPVAEPDIPITPAVSREEVNEWLEEFAPVIEPDEDAPEPSRPRRPTDRTSDRSERASDDRSSDRDEPSRDSDDSNRSPGQRNRRSTDKTPDDSEPRTADAPDASDDVDTSTEADKIAEYGPPQGPRLDDILKLNEAHIPGVTWAPTPRTKPPVLPVDWNAPLLWSDDNSDPMSLEQPAPAAPTPETIEPEEEAEPGPPPWPAPPPLDEAGVPIMTPITSWSPAEPVEWGWAEAWPDGSPVDWHTQSLPVAPEPPLVAAVDERPPPPPPPPATEAATPAIETDQTDAVDPVLDPADTEADSQLDPDLLPVVDPSVPTSESVAWAEDLPLPEDRPAPPGSQDFVVDTPIPGMTRFGSGMSPSGPKDIEWNAAIADDSEEFAAPAPPTEWLDEGNVDELGQSAPEAPKELGGGADPQPDPSLYHEPITPDGAGANELPGSNNVDYPQHGGGSEPDETLPSLDPVFTDWAPAQSEPAAVGSTTPIASAQTPGFPRSTGGDAPIGRATTADSGVFEPGPEPPLFDTNLTAPSVPPKTRLEAPQPPGTTPAPDGLIATIRANPATRLLFEWVPLLLGAFILAMIVRFFVFQAYYIPSGSMIPTLEVRDRVLVNKLSYNFHDVNRGDILVFKRPEGTDGTVDDLIKRVIGLPGETLVFRNGNVYVDGQLVQESYLQEQDSTFPIAGIPGCTPAGTSSECTVPADHVFVMGDNRRGSTDGRVFGPIPEDTIVGRAFVKVWPIGEIGLM